MLKGLGILLMMLGHLVIPEGMIRQLVYSFHMPLFFLISGSLVKDVSSWTEFVKFTKRNARRLLLPYFATMLILCVWGALQALLKKDMGYFIRHALSMLTASADGWNTRWGAYLCRSIMVFDNVVSRARIVLFFAIMVQ